VRNTLVPRVGELRNELVKNRPSRHWIKPERGVVEDEELGARAERQGKRNLRAFSLGELAERHLERYVSAPQPFEHAGGIPARVELGAKSCELARRHRDRRIG
jgi:hypothetical protein